MYSIFFYTNKIIISETNVNCPNYFDISNIREELERIKKIKNSTFCIPCNNENQTFEKFTDFFVKINAAGGLVVNSNDTNKLLLIKRNNIWDLPKGKVEPNEPIEKTAIREVKEECGINNLEIKELITTTLHIYDTYGQWTIKKTFWYKMLSTDIKLFPQQEEGISEAVWVDCKTALSLKNNMYPLIYDIVKDYCNK